MIISIALLGFGASGTFITLAQRWLVERYAAAFAASAALFGITAVASFAIVERLPFNALEIIWDPRQLGWLAASYALLIPPFFLGAICVGLAFCRYPEQIGRVYAFDLVGAGIGALGIVGLLFLVFPSTALQMVAALGIRGGCLCRDGHGPPSVACCGRLWAGSGLCCGVVAAALDGTRAAYVAVQGPAHGPGGSECAGHRGAIEPTRIADGCREPDRPFPSGSSLRV